VSAIQRQRQDTEAPLRAHVKAVCSKACLRTGAFHDTPSTTHDRGHAGEELLTA
jgi:site-specific recombinase XerD